MTPVADNRAANAAAQYVTAEDLKAVARSYADRHLPGWACAGISFRVGEIGSCITEMLLVMPASANTGGTPHG